MMSQYFVEGTEVSRPLRTNTIARPEGASFDLMLFSAARSSSMCSMTFRDITVSYSPSGNELHVGNVAKRGLHIGTLDAQVAQSL